MSAPRRIVVLLNGGSGGGRDGAFSEHLSRLFEQAGAPASIVMPLRGDDLASVLQRVVADAPAIVVAAGGDGTVGAVAAALVDSDIALGVLPLGTLNHFAKDLGLPLNLEAAVHVVAQGESRRIDVGDVNGRVFVNNSSLGLYPDIVHERERQQEHLGRSKWLAFASACVGALRRYPFLDVRLTVDDGARAYRTPFVFIGNNDYRMDGLAIGQRNSLDDGVLSLYVARRPGRWRLVQLALRALAGRLREARDFNVAHARQIIVQSHHRHLRVATDGEVNVMTPPLEYRIRRGALQVVCRAPASSPVPPEPRPGLFS